MDRKTRKELRFRNFDQLLARYNGSPVEFCEGTGYGSQTTISQLKTRRKAFGSDLARELERVAKLEPFALESEDGIDGKSIRPGKQAADWPFSVSMQDISRLHGKSLREIDEALTKMVMGAQAQEMLNKQRSRKSQ